MSPLRVILKAEAEKGAGDFEGKRSWCGVTAENKDCHDVFLRKSANLHDVIRSRPERVLHRCFLQFLRLNQFESEINKN